MKKEIKKIEDKQIRDFIKTIDGFTPEQIKACEVYSDYIAYFLRLFGIHTIEDISSAMDRLEDLRDHSKKYLSTDLFEYILYMSESELEEALSKLKNKYPEFNIIGKNGQVVYRYDLAQEKQSRDLTKKYGKLLKDNPNSFKDVPEIDIEEEDYFDSDW